MEANLWRLASEAFEEIAKDIVPNMTL